MKYFMNKPGFTIIELLVATLVGSMLTVILSMILYQMNQTQNRVDRLVDVYERAELVYHQLERDLLGAFIPVQAEDIKPTGTQAQKKPKKIDKVFYGDNKLDTLTFITNNPLQAYWGPKSGKAQPKVVRVVYRLVPDKAKKNSYILQRQESGTLDFGRYNQESEKKIRGYDLIRGVKEIAIEYTAMVAIKEVAEKKPGQEERDITFESQKVKEWKPKKESETEAQLFKPLIPQYLNVHMHLWDDSYKRVLPFTFVFLIPTSFDVYKKQLEKRKQEKPQPPKEQKPSTLPAANQRSVPSSGAVTVRGGRSSTTGYLTTHIIHERPDHTTVSTRRVTPIGVRS
jgi:prepilin-type N-terminal cleavage/methylation domain-containing protein